MDERNIVNVLRHVRQQRRDFLATVSTSDECPGRCHQIAVGTLERGDFLSARKRLARLFVEFRFVVPQIQVRRRARAENLQDPFRLCREMGLTMPGLPVGTGTDRTRFRREQTVTTGSKSSSPMPAIAVREPFKNPRRSSSAAYGECVMLPSQLIVISSLEFRITRQNAGKPYASIRVTPAVNSSSLGERA